VCYLLCGEVALAQQRLAIARDCGRAACDQFPQARWPRHLYAQALIAGGAFHEAEAELESTFEIDPDDRESLALWFTSRRKLEQRPGPRLADVVRTGVDDPAIDAELLANALPDNAPAAWLVARKVAQRSATDDTISPELLALAARVLAPSAPADARALLDRARQRLPKAGPAAAIAVVDATIAWICALAATTADEPLAAKAAAELRHLEILPASARALLDAGAALEKQHPHTAWELAGTALALRDAAEQRDGESFLLAARLLLRLGRLEPAAEHLTAAVSFPDGEAAAEPLARMLLLRDQPDRAA
jgi:tetratricopeptide (TPR) repeat protein